MALIPAGHAIKELREANGWNLRTFAREAQVSAGYLSKIENDLASNVSPEVLRRIAETFRVPLVALTPDGRDALAAAVTKAKHRLRTPQRTKTTAA